MNLVGKIITLLILLLSVCFLMIAVMVYSHIKTGKTSR